ncbi:MAG: hypothetical protein JJU36_07280 [Phycisphaeraceae bacterium]|nr:hypothetical protein [Phycisphaeraceae bacterium]
MSMGSVVVEKLRIERALAIGRGEGFVLEGLSGGVNLVFGPNGSGKTTTARVIHELMWPGSGEMGGLVAEGWFRTGAGICQLSLEPGLKRATRDGLTAAWPDFGPAEQRGRYVLALHELITADNREFAQALVRESRGGYDLDGAARALGYSDRPSAPRKLQGELAEAEKRVQEAKAQQQKLNAEFERLGTLRGELEDAERAEREVGLLTAAGEYRSSAEQCRELEERKRGFPAMVEKLTGDEKDRLAGFDKRLKEIEAQLESERASIAKSEAAIKKAAVPNGFVGDSGEQKLNQWRSWQRRLGEVEREVRDTQKSRAEKARLRDEAQKLLTGLVEPGRLAKLGHVEPAGLTELGREAERWRVKEALLAERRRWLDRQREEIEQDGGRGRAGADGEAMSAEVVGEGITLLSNWLRCVGGDVAAGGGRVGEASGGRAGAGIWRVLFWVAVGWLGVVAVVLGLVVDVLWLLLLLVVAAGLSGAGLWLGRSRAETGPGSGDGGRSVFAGTYERLGLTVPEGWRVDAVTERLAELVGRMRRLEREGEWAGEKQRLDDLAAEVDRQQKAVMGKRQQVEEQLGVRLEISEQWLAGFAEHLRVWQRAEIELAGLDERGEVLERERAELVEKLSTGVAAMGYTGAGTADEFGWFVDQAGERVRCVREEGEKVKEAGRRVDRSGEQRSSLIDERRVFFEGLGLDDGDVLSIDRGLTELDEYRDVSKQLRDALVRRNMLGERLGGRSELGELDEADLTMRLHEETERAANREGLQAAINKIEFSVGEAKERHDLDEAIAARDAKAAELAKERYVYVSEALGDLLRRWVAESSLDASRGEVFERANRYLVLFTRGLLRLEMEQDEKGLERFVARRSETSVSGVDELSVGERVQLLMAVRLAFIEQHEVEKLPLLLDEVLGTSDDDRAGVIIDAVIEIARQGRQVFYFTAQHDETGKWVGRLKQAGMGYQVIDLGEVRGMGRMERLPVEGFEAPARVVPEPEGMGHAEFGKALGVYSIDPWHEDAGRIHLWHVVEEVTLLHRLLDQGFTTWGQLANLLISRADQIEGLDDRERKVLRLRVRVIKRATELWRHGRGRLVNREVLIATDAVSDEFMEQICEFAESVDGDGRALVDRLQAGPKQGVAGFGPKKIEKLRDSLEDGGFITDQTMMSHQQIEEELVAEFSGEIHDGHLEVNWIRRIISQLPG